MPSFPSYRPRRLRRTAALRRLVRETRLHPSQLVLPLFVRSGTGVRQPVESMPGVDQTSVDELLRDAREAAALGDWRRAVVRHSRPQGCHRLARRGTTMRPVQQARARAQARAAASWS